MINRTTTLSGKDQPAFPFRGALQYVGVFLFYAVLFLLISLITHPEVLRYNGSDAGTQQVEPGK